MKTHIHRFAAPSASKQVSAACCPKPFSLPPGSPQHIYSASKQVSAALNPENEAAKAFQECVLIKHPRHGEYAFGFITGRTTLQVSACVACVPPFKLNLIKCRGQKRFDLCAVECIS